MGVEVAGEAAAGFGAVGDFGGVGGVQGGVVEQLAVFVEEEVELRLLVGVLLLRALGALLLLGSALHPVINKIAVKLMSCYAPYNIPTHQAETVK